MLFKALYEKCKLQSNIKFQLNQDIKSLTEIKTMSNLLNVANGSHSTLRKQIPIKQSYQLYPLWTTIEDDQITYVNI